MMNFRAVTASVMVSMSAGGVMGGVMAAPGDEIHKVTAGDGAANDLFGTAVAVHDGVAVVGARLADEHGLNSGSVYLVSVETGGVIAELDSGDISGGDEFGSAVAIDAQHVVAGAPNCDEEANNAGCAIVFDRASGNQSFLLVASDAESSDNFGESVAVLDGFAVVGAFNNDDQGSQSGSAYVFNTATGAQVWKLLPDDGDSFDLFGFAVGVNDSVAVVSARGDEVNGANSGSVYLFDLGSGMQLSKIDPSDGQAGAQFGRSVSVMGDVLLVGAIADNGAGADAGAAYLFDISDPSNPSEEGKLIADDAAGGDNFGVSVALGDDGEGGMLAAVGAWRDDVGVIDSGSAYLFDVTDIADPELVVQVVASDLSEDDEFGTAVGVSDGAMVVGSPDDDEVASNAGAVYVFEAGVGDALCAVDLNADGQLNFLDISAFLSAYAAGDLIADFTGDGVFNFLDISEFLAQYAVGCP